MTAPWGLSFQLNDRGCPSFSRGRLIGDEPLAVFHAVLEGSCEVQLDVDAAPVRVSAGDLIILPRADPHSMRSAAHVSARPFFEVAAGHRGGPLSLLEHGGGGAPFRTICGTFSVEAGPGAALLGLLPAVMVVPAGDPFVAQTLLVLERELTNPGRGTNVIVERLADVLFIAALRHVIDGSRPLAGWLAAMQDEQIGRALALMHERPGDDWTVDSLAAKVGLSRTKFFERFTELMDEPPARYLARQRMQLASRLLRQPHLSVAQAGSLVGYESEDAFVRVFKRHHGQSPAKYRKRVVQPERAAG